MNRGSVTLLVSKQPQCCLVLKKQLMCICFFIWVYLHSFTLYSLNHYFLNSPFCIQTAWRTWLTLRGWGQIPSVTGQCHSTATFEGHIWKTKARSISQVHKHSASYLQKASVQSRNAPSSTNEIHNSILCVVTLCRCRRLSGGRRELPARPVSTARCSEEESA